MSLLRTRSRSKNVRLYFSLDEGFHAIAPASIESARLPSRLRSRRFPITRHIHFADRARAETRTSLHSKSLLTACTIHARLNFIYVHAHSRDFQSYQKEKERKREKEREREREARARYQSNSKAAVYFAGSFLLTRCPIIWNAAV